MQLIDKICMIATLEQGGAQFQIFYCSDAHARIYIMLLMVAIHIVKNIRLTLLS